MDGAAAAAAAAVDDAPPELSPLEQDVLDEYERLAENMKKVCVCVCWLPFASVSPRRLLLLFLPPSISTRHLRRRCTTTSSLPNALCFLILPFPFHSSSFSPPTPIQSS